MTLAHVMRQLFWREEADWAIREEAQLMAQLREIAERVAGAEEVARVMREVDDG